MKISSQKLSQIISESIAEVIDRKNMKTANMYANANMHDFSRKHDTPENLFQMIKVGLSKRKDVNGLLDILNSANEIYPLINMFNGEIKKLQTAYNWLSRRQNGDYVPQKRVVQNPLTQAQKDARNQTRRANAAMRQQIMNQYGNLDPSYAYIDNNSAQNSTPIQNSNNDTMRRTADYSSFKNGYDRRHAGLNRVNQPVIGNGWLGSVNEGIFNGGIDEVDNILATYRKMPQEQMASAAKKVWERLYEYKNIVAELQHKLDYWTGADGSNAVIYDRNAQARAERDAALKAVGKRGSNRMAANGLNESVEKAGSNAIKKILG